MSTTVGPCSLIGKLGRAGGLPNKSGVKKLSFGIPAINFHDVMDTPNKRNVE